MESWPAITTEEVPWDVSDDDIFLTYRSISH